MEPTSKRKEHEIFIEKIHQLASDLHFHHWNTRSYAEHKALDFAYGAVDGLIDDIVERLIGYVGRFNGFKVITPSTKLMDLPKEIMQIGSDLRTMATKNKWNDLVNTSDEVTAIGPKLQYLLTLS